MRTAIGGRSRSAPRSDYLFGFAAITDASQVIILINSSHPIGKQQLRYFHGNGIRRHW